MLFSAHVADSGPLNVLKRSTPKAADSPGLKSARVGIAAPFNRAPIPVPQLSREVMVACWEHEDALDEFLSDHATGQSFAEGWHVRMELFRAVGVWPGLDDDMQAEARRGAAPGSGPSVAITIGTAYLKTAVPFIRVTNGLDRQFLDSTTAIWGTALSNLPQRMVATLTIWDTAKSASDYMRNGAHGAAMRDHYDPGKDPTGHTFVSGGGFFGFRPLSVSGAVSGKTPPPLTLT